MKFNSAYNKQYKSGYLPIGDRVTDTTGYITPNVRINSMIAAGEKLVEFRDEQALILNEIYADERALPYNPSELDMLELNAKTSVRAEEALKRMRRYQEDVEAQNKAKGDQLAEDAAKGAPDTATAKSEQVTKTENQTPPK